MIVMMMLMPILVVSVLNVPKAHEYMTTISAAVFNRIRPAIANESHTMTFALSVANSTLLDKWLNERSDPYHPLYQQWMTTDQIDTATNSKKTKQIVLEWLHKFNVTLIKSTPGYLTFIGNVGVWESVLKTHFYVWHHTVYKKQYIRADHYFLPDFVSEFVSTVMAACQPPPVIVDFSNLGSIRLRRRRLESVVSISFLNTLYKIPSNHGSASLNQAVAATFSGGDQSFSNQDLNLFQINSGILKKNVTIWPTTNPAPSTSAECKSSGLCYEGNLDTQYLAGISQVTNTIFMFSDQEDVWVTILSTIYAMPTNLRPSVLSISYGSDEIQYPPVYMNQFNVEAQKLALLGVTIFVASGDSGVSSANCLGDSSSSMSSWDGVGVWQGEGYFPSWPATSPYVVAVGATNGPEYGAPNEIVSQPAVAYSYTVSAAYNGQGTSITSGGGFSTYFSRPSWQNVAVETYLANHGKYATNGYNPNGRAYPDVSFLGVNFQPYVGGTTAGLCGTSASAPSFAAMVSLVNSKRLSLGMTTVGFINPTLYAKSSLFTDIVSGSNYCTFYSGSNNNICCNSGFNASAGWDPASGLGTITFDNLFLALSPPPTLAPSKYPTLAPTVLPSIYPTLAPTVLPSIYPTLEPTLAPTVLPSIYPTLEPTLAPTVLPSIYPTLAPTLAPTVLPSIYPTLTPTSQPSKTPTHIPTKKPTSHPSKTPTHIPTKKPIHKHHSEPKP